jgi:hypothetical protein
MHYPSVSPYFSSRNRSWTRIKPSLEKNVRHRVQNALKFTARLVALVGSESRAITWSSRKGIGMFFSYAPESPRAASLRRAVHAAAASTSTFAATTGAARMSRP